MNPGMRTRVVLAVLTLVVGTLPVEQLSSASVDFDIIDLGTLGGRSSQVFAINSRGQIVGVSATASGDDHAFLWQDGTMSDLGTLGGTYSLATGINARGQVAGESESAPGQFHAFLWQHGTMSDLGTLGGNSFSVAITTADKSWASAGRRRGTTSPSCGRTAA